MFKGEKAKKKAKKKSKHGRPASSTTGIVGSSVSPETEVESSLQSSCADQTIGYNNVNTESAAVCTRKGTGSITTSGPVVTGHGTRFENEIDVGDAILVEVNDSQEMRVVTMRLSNISLNLSSPFSISIKLPTEYHFIRKPKDHSKIRDLKQSKIVEEMKERERHSYDKYNSTTELVYREKTESGSYRIRREGLAKDATRTDLLEMRSKKKHDKYC